jgi:hypothetical protein
MVQFDRQADGHSTYTVAGGAQAGESDTRKCAGSTIHAAVRPEGAAGTPQTERAHGRTRGTCSKERKDQQESRQHGHQPHEHKSSSAQAQTCAVASPRVRFPDVARIFDLKIQGKVQHHPMSWPLQVLVYAPRRWWAVVDGGRRAARGTRQAVGCRFLGTKLTPGPLVSACGSWAPS